MGVRVTYPMLEWRVALDEIRLYSDEETGINAGTLLSGELFLVIEKMTDWTYPSQYRVLTGLGQCYCDYTMKRNSRCV